MYITEEKYKEICKKYNTLLLSDGDAEDALNFAQDILEAEADALKEREPQATNSIARLNAAAYELYDICRDVSNEDFGEVSQNA